jgi:hypothetical protein
MHLKSKHTYIHCVLGSHALCLQSKRRASFADHALQCGGVAWLRQPSEGLTVCGRLLSFGHVLTVSFRHVLTVSFRHVLTVSFRHVLTVSFRHVLTPGARTILRLHSEGTCDGQAHNSRLKHEIAHTTFSYVHMHVWIRIRDLALHGGCCCPCADTARPPSRIDADTARPPSRIDADTARPPSRIDALSWFTPTCMCVYMCICV